MFSILQYARLCLKLNTNQTEMKTIYFDVSGDHELFLHLKRIDFISTEQIILCVCASSGVQFTNIVSFCY
jgi:hypothetical protein